MEKIEKEYYIKGLRERYRKARKGRKGEILTEVGSALGVSRRQARRLMEPEAAGRPRKPGKRGRRGKYQDREFTEALRTVWRLSRFMCSRFLKSAMPEWLPAIEEVRGRYRDSVRERLLTISPPTIDRILKPWKGIKGFSLTRSGGFRDEIPIQGSIWNIQQPGWLEVDTVGHCGGSTMGEYVNSLTMVDIATTWTENRAVFSKASGPIVTAIEDIESGLPFDLLGYDCDNGTEVLNRHVLRYFRDERTERGRTPIQVTRSRAYKKNDNAHVEQKNNSVARRWLGYERFDYPEICPLINYYLRDIIGPMINHFFPSFKLAEKILIRARRHRIYGAPITPYARVMASPYVPQERKIVLQSIHESLNPIELSRKEFSTRKRIDQAIKLLRSGKDASALLWIPSPSVSPHAQFRAAKPELALYRQAVVSAP